MTTAQLQAVEELLAMNRIEEALEKLRELLQNSRHYEDVLLQSGRFYQIKKEYEGGRLDIGPFSVGSAQVRAALLSLIADAKKELAKAAPPAPPRDSTDAITELERQGYEKQLLLATQKLQRMETAWLLETDPARQFAYENEIDKLKNIISDLKTNLNP